MEKIQNAVADAPTRKMYVTPEIEAIDLNVEGPLLSASVGGASLQNIDDEEEF
jgi:hypothetical protein